MDTTGNFFPIDINDDTDYIIREGQRNYALTKVNEAAIILRSTMFTEEEYAIIKSIKETLITKLSKIDELDSIIIRKLPKNAIQQEIKETSNL